MTQPYPFTRTHTTLPTPWHAKRLPQRGFVQVGFWEITLQGIADLETLSGPVTPVLAKYSKSFSLIDRISLDIDRMQRNFEPMHKQVEAW